MPARGSAKFPFDAPVRVYCGLCPECHDVDLYAGPHRSLITCLECGSEHPVAALEVVPATARTTRRAMDRQHVPERGTRELE